MLGFLCDLSSGSDFSDLCDSKNKILDEFMYNKNRNNDCCTDDLNFNQKEFL